MLFFFLYLLFVQVRRTLYNISGYFTCLLHILSMNILIPIMSVDKVSVGSLISDKGNWSNSHLWMWVWDLNISNQNEPSLKSSPCLRFFRLLTTYWGSMKTHLHIFVTLPMLKDFKANCWQYMSSVCRFIGIFLYISVLIGMVQLVNSIYCHFFLKAVLKMWMCSNMVDILRNSLGETWISHLLMGNLVL